MAVTLPSRVTRGLQPFFERDPFRALQDEMDDLLSRFSRDWNGEWLTHMHAPSMDLSETENAVQIRMDMPGIKAKDIDIELTGNTLRISGERKEEKEEKGETHHCLERRMGSFARSLTLPCAVKEEGIQAECRDGVLTVTLPKTEEAKTRKITVQGEGK